MFDPFYFFMDAFMCTLFLAAIYDFLVELFRGGKDEGP